MAVIIGIILLFSTSISFSQEIAVWIATAHAIDYPKTKTSSDQQEELKEIVREAHAKGINTLYFQVRGRGDAMYQSSIEPWSQVLTGQLGREPGFDPLNLIIAEAKKYNMKVVGWFNVFKIADATNQTVSQSKKKHPKEANPSWMIKAGSEWFLNPGIPEVRKYIAQVAKDLVTNYALDGIQLDFVRYPTESFSDKNTVNKFKKKNQLLPDWRRSNVTETVREIRQAIRSVRKTIELSAAPLGIWKIIPNAKGLESYHQVYQDSFGWARSGLIDRVIPQLYWSIGNEPESKQGNPSPDFKSLIEHWSNELHPVPVVAGIGLYKPQIYREAQQQVDVALAAGADGVAYYSWQFFKTLPIPTVNVKKQDKTDPVQIPKKVSENGFRVEKLTKKQWLVVSDQKDIADWLVIIMDINGIEKKHIRMSGHTATLVDIESDFFQMKLTDGNRQIVFAEFTIGDE